MGLPRGSDERAPPTAVGSIQQQVGKSARVPQKPLDPNRVRSIAEARRQQELRKQEEAQKSAQQASIDWDERLTEVMHKFAAAKVDVDSAIEVARAAITEDVDDAVIAEAKSTLEETSKAISVTQRYIAMEGLAAAKAPQEIKANIIDLGQKGRKLQQTLKEEIVRITNARANQEKEREEALTRMVGNQKAEAIEFEQAKQLEEMLLPATEKVVSAEEEVDKAEMAAAPLQIDMADDLQEVMMQAIKDTELLVRNAQNVVSEARRFIQAKVAQAQKFVANQKQAAAEEFGGLQKRLATVQERLKPFKNVRQDYEQRMQNRKFLEELSAKLAGAEIEVEKAAMMTAPLGVDNFDGIKETERALSGAQTALSQTTRLLAAKLKTVSAPESSGGPLADELTGMQLRAKEAQEKLDDVRKTLKETQVRVQADALLQEVSGKVTEVEDQLQVMGDAELPFLKGDEKSLDMDALLEEAAQISQKVHNALAEAQTLMARKLVEVARYADGPAKFVKEEMDLLQKRLENGRERLQQFRSSTADRQRAHLLTEVESKVSLAEDNVKQMREAIQVVKNSSKPGEPIGDAFADVVETANAAERSTQASIVVARKYLLQKTAELKRLNIAGAGSGSELGKLQTRVNNMQQEVVKLKTATKDAEEKMRVKQLLAEVVMRLQAAESEVQKVASVAVMASSGSEAPSVEAVERLDRASSSAEAKLTATAKVVDVKLRSAEGLLKEELTGMRKRIDIAELKLQEVLKAAKDQKERAEAANLLGESRAAVQEAEAALQQAVEAEAPFLKGVEGMSAVIWQSAITSCEAKAAVAQKAISEGRKLIAERLAAARKMATLAADACAKDLDPLRKRLDTAASKLSELKRDMAERRRRTQMQESGEKVKAIEAAVQKLAEIFAKVPEDQWNDLSIDEAQQFCEEARAVDTEAQEGCSDARKYLAQRQQEAKAFSEAQRAAMVAELNKLQSRLTHCQVELTKLSKQCQDREDRLAEKVQQRSEVQEAKPVRKMAVVKAKPKPKPAAEVAAEFLRLKALRDGASGWVLLQDSPDAEPVAARREGVYVCRSAIALTDGVNLKECKIIRKVKVGEALEGSPLKEEPRQDGANDAGIQRVEVTSLSDGLKGYVSLEGNKGTTYVERHAEPVYVVLKQADLLVAPTRDASVLRALDVGEALEVFSKDEPA